LIGTPGWQELLLILLIVLIIFGPRKLPEVAEAIGKSIQKFKKASREVQQEIKTSVEEEEDSDKKLQG
jgi:sec-independent protein translocase protein TatA